MTTNKRKDRAYSYAVILAFVLLATIARASNPQETVLYSFQGTPDGEFPTGRLAQDSAGNLYGVATNGGTPGNGCGGQCGIVFELSPLTSQNGSWSEAVIYDFQGVNVGDGDYPLGGPIWGVDKRLYGTTGYGGGGNCVLLGGHVGCGTVYELIPPSTSSGAWTESVIYSFQGGTDGYFPTGELVSDNQGNLYGATYFGGGLGQCDAGIYPHCGTVFELSPPSTNGGVWTEKVLYSFVNGPNGAQPNGSLVFDTKGALYGTTQYGGTLGCINTSGKGCGVAFKLTPPATGSGPWAETVIHSFSTKTSDGAFPFAGVIFDKLGNLYGTAYAGGNAWPAHAGAVYELSPPIISGEPWIETLLCSFGFGRTGANPTAGLVFDGGGNLYGTTGADGGYGGGTAFRLKPPSTSGGTWTFAVLHAFQPAPDANVPSGTLIFGRGGKLFGIGMGGGTGTGGDCSPDACGAVFAIAP